MMHAIVKRLFFKNTKIKTFFISRLDAAEVDEKVFLKSRKFTAEVSGHHAMICLDPFCLAVWTTTAEMERIDTTSILLEFKKGDKLNASIALRPIEIIPTAKGALFLLRVKRVRNYHFNALRRLVFFGYLLKSKANTFYSRRVVSALYSYPRSIIIVSYQDKNYCNVFPMDIHGYIPEEDMYILGLRTTNKTLEKILEAKKVLVCDTDTVDINTVYALGKHPSAAPTPLGQLPFKTSPSEIFGFPVPDFTGSYKEVEIIRHKKMGYHMLMMGKVVNAKQLKENPKSFYHVGFLQFQTGSYESVEGVY
jgi:flavin reductase (DIM6/NTAB) family NADH-FMN oxidoreductase RutF